MLALAQNSSVLAARDSMEKGDFRKTSEALERMLSVEPKRDAELYVMLAVCLVNMDKREAALQAAEAGLRVFPGSANIAGYYSAMIAQLLTPIEARERLEKSVQEHPASPLLLKALGKAMLHAKDKNGRTGKLLADARRMLPQDAEAHFLHGQWACLHQQEALCAEALRASLRLTPASNHQAKTLTNGLLAVALQRLDRPAEAKLAFERALAANRQMEPFAPEIAFQYVKFLTARSERALARKVLDEIIRRSPEFAPAHLERAQSLVREDRMEQAHAQALLALKYSGSEKVQMRAIRSLLVMVCSALGRADEAGAHQAWVDSNQ